MNGLSSQIAAYFPSGQNVINGYRQTMANSGEDSDGAKAAGFSIMDSIGSLSRQIAVNTAAGEQLTKGLIKCMFELPNPTAFPKFPDSSIYNFGAALASAEGGAFYTRGPGAGSDSVVLARDDGPDPDNTLTGVAPPVGSTWSGILGQRVLLYGFPISALPASAANPLEYEWATIPGDATFSPYARVGICDGDLSNTAMVHESSIGVLAYGGDATFCAEPRRTVLRDGWGPKALGMRLASLFAPTPLHATSLALTGGSGSASKFKSRFTKKNVSNIKITFVAQPPANVPVNTTFNVAVTVSAVDGAALLPIATCIYLTGTNNNGFFKQLVGPVDGDCDDDRPAGIPAGVPSMKTAPFNSTQSKADFGKTIFVTGPGGLIVTATAKPLDRSGTGSNFVKTNIKPK